jgi:hypothetical protein
MELKVENELLGSEPAVLLQTQLNSTQLNSEPLITDKPSHRRCLS